MESLAHCTPATPTKKRSVFIPDLNCYEEIPDIVEFRYVPVSLEKSGIGSSGSSKMMSPPLAPITPEKEGEGLGGGSRKRRVEEFGVLHNLEIEAKIVGGEGEGSEEEGVEEIDLNKSPKKKVTRRKKHRPKVVFDDKKVVKSPKVVTPKKAGEKKERVVPKRVATQKKKGLDTPEKVEESGESVMGKEKCLSEQDTPAVEISTNKGKQVIAKTYIRKKKLLSSLDTPLDKSKEVKVLEKTYVRRQRGSNATTMTESAARGTVDELPVNAVKSVRRRLSFGVEDEDKSRPEFTVELPAGIAIDLNRSLNQGLEEYLGLSEDPALSTLSCRGEIIRESMVVTDVIENVENGVAMQGKYEKADSDSCKNGILIDDDTEKTGTKRNHDHSSVIQHCCTDDFLGDACFLGGYTEVKKTSLWQGMGNLIEYFPIVHKKRRTNRGKPWGSNRAIMNNFGCHAFADAQNSTKLDKLEQSSLLPTFDQIRIITKKRSKIPNRARKLTTLACSRLLWYPEKIEESLDKPENRSHDSQTCMEALAADTRFRIITKKPRNKVHYDLARSSLNNEIPKQSFVVGLSESSAGDGKNLQTYKIGGSFYTCFESLAVVPYMDPTENIVEKMKHLYLNENQVDHISKMHNSLIPYGGDSMMVPYRNLFDQFKKRRLRAKVDLDPETNRAWDLLMGNKHNKEADNAEMDKKKWEEERKIFHGRAELFIARMHLILGDRRFSKWNGSVVDSVVGVFLTQNVSDHLSSSAFMALAAKYPLKSKGNSSEANDEKRSASTEQGDGSILDSDDTVDSEENVMVPEANYAGSEEKENETSEIRISPGSNNRNETDYLEGRDQEIGLDTTQNGTYTQVTAPVVIVLEDSDDETSMQDLVSSQNSVISSEKNSEHLIQTTLVAEDPIIKNKYSGLDNPTSIVENMFIRETNTTHESYPNQDGETLASEYIDTVYEDKDYLIVEKKKNSSEKLDGLGNDSDITKIFYVKIVEESPTSGQAKEVEPQASGSKLCSHTSTTSETQIFLEKHYGCRNRNTNEKLEDSVEESISHKCPQVEDENTVIVHPKEIYADLKVENICQEFCREQSKCMRAHNELEAAAESVKMTEFNLKDEACCSQRYQPDMVEGISQATKVNAESEKKKMNHWENLRKKAFMNGAKNERSSEELDSLDWEAIRNADATEIAHTIRERGMNNVLAQRIKDFLNRLVEDHGSIDLEWLKHIPPAEVKEYLLSIRGLGIKSVECVRLLTLQHLAFPVDTNVGRICVRLGWVPLQPLPESLQLHLLELYPMIEHIQKYLWPRLCHLDQRTLYELHYQMITFGKVFCTKTKPNCNACPMRGECKHFASAFASARLALSGPEEKRIVTSRNPSTFENEGKPGFSSILRPLLENSRLSRGSVGNNNEPVIEEPATPEQSEPIIEEPATPEHERIETLKHDIEDAFYEDSDEIPTIKLSFEEFKNNLISYMQENNVDIQDDNMSNALVAITPDVASIPMPKLKNISRLRTEHHVYELPDSHPLLEGIDRRVPDDPCPYLLAIWTPGETAQSTEPPQSCCNSQGSAKLCDKKTCFACNSKRETQAQTVRGTLLIPCRTAMRGSFPLNGTYFQVNEVFADHGSSHMPINVPREWIWNLPRRTVYFGSSVSTIFKGLTTEGIQQCFWRGFLRLDPKLVDKESVSKIGSKVGR